jgi:hypothetical protein
MQHGAKATVFVAGICVALLLAACGGGGEDSAAQQNPPSNPPSNPPANGAPTISGTPATQVLQGSQYSFTPTASDPNGDTLTFSIQGMPSWASFTPSTGRLQGTPGAGDVGSYTNIRIAVSDGTTTANLTAFSIAVVGTATGQASLSWTPPTQNTDNSPVTLTGYRVYWGSSRGNYTNSVTVNNGGLSAYVVTQLTPGTWYFVVTAISATGESAYSNEAQKTI